MDDVRYRNYRNFGAGIGKEGYGVYKRCSAWSYNLPCRRRWA
jgi:hypothetical protein